MAPPRLKVLLVYIEAVLVIVFIIYPNFETLNRFETQEDTGKHLQELQNRAEKEIRDLGAVKEKLEAEWELVKFMGQEENTELREKLEILEEDITDQQVRVNWSVSGIILLFPFPDP